MRSGLIIEMGMWHSESKHPHHARVAQSVEHFVGNEEVTGSNPVAGSISSIRSYHTTPV